MAERGLEARRRGSRPSRLRGERQSSRSHGLVDRIHINFRTMGDSATMGHYAIPMKPLGAELDVRREADAGLGIEGLRDKLKAEVEQHALVLVRGLDEFASSTGMSIPDTLEEIMCGFGPREGSVKFSSNHDDSTIVPGHPSIRILGNSVDAKTGKPNALLANVGYCWHQDSVWYMISYTCMILFTVTFYQTRHQ